MGLLVAVAVGIALGCYLIGSIASYLLEWWLVGRRRKLSEFLFKPWG